MLKIEHYVLLPTFQTNTWLFWDTASKEAILIDPSAPSDQLLQQIRQLQLRVKLVINTHGHGDHIGGNTFFSEFLPAPIAIHPLDADMLTNNRKNMSDYMGTPLELNGASEFLKDDDEIVLGDFTVKVIHTPGHTRGGICLFADKYLISGDTLFERSIGRTDLPGGDHPTLVNSIKSRLYSLNDDVLVFPGHGPVTSIGLEKANNPFVR